MKRSRRARSIFSKQNIRLENASAGASVECLESRVFLSGNVIAQVVDGNLTISGDSAGNVIFMNETRLAAHRVRIFGGDGTTINNQSGSVILNGIKGDALIRMDG